MVKRSITLWLFHLWLLILHLLVRCFCTPHTLSLAWCSRTTSVSLTRLIGFCSLLLTLPSASCSIGVVCGTGHWTVCDCVAVSSYSLQSDWLLPLVLCLYEKNMIFDLTFSWLTFMVNLWKCQKRNPATKICIQIDLDPGGHYQREKI